MKIVVYTVVSGGYDKIKPVRDPLAGKNNIDYIIVSDEYIDPPFGWDIVIVDKPSDMSSTDFNRLYKIKNDLLFRNYDFSLYIDGNIEIIAENIMSLLDDCKGNNISLYSHPERSSVKDEALLLTYLGFDTLINIKKQYELYVADGFKDESLFECNVIFRKHNQLIYNMMDFWFAQYLQYVKRDQLSFTYAAWKYNVTINNLGESDPRFLHDHFIYHYHVKKNINKKNKNKIINRILLKLKIWK